MQYQIRDTIAYLESENVPAVQLSVFKKKNKPQKIVKDLSHIADKVNEVKQVTRPAKKLDPEPVKETKSVMDGNVERRVRPLRLEFLDKKKKAATWL